MPYSIIEADNNIYISNLTNFSTTETFDCGQCFRFNKLENGNYRGIAHGKILEIGTDESSNKSIICLYNTSQEEFNSIWKTYLDLDRDYLTIQNRLIELDNRLSSSIEYAGGIRILKQDPWEALCSFIISQNNNIPRIKGIVERLCISFGEKINENDYAFPTAQRLSSVTVDELAPIRSGFRAGYILDSAKKIASNEVDIDKISSMPISDARIELMKIKGVGPKVAECALLYGFGRIEAFPMDVWMKRAMKEMFPEKTSDFFGEYAGIAQQYIFHYARTNYFKNDGK